MMAIQCISEYHCTKYHAVPRLKGFLVAGILFTSRMGGCLRFNRMGHFSLSRPVYFVFMSLVKFGNFLTNGKDQL